MKCVFDPIPALITELQKGKLVILVDDADRENEGDLIMAAEKVTPAAVNFMAKHGRGLICVPTTSDRLKPAAGMVPDSASRSLSDAPGAT